MTRFKDKPLDFQPGKKWSYSTSGYILLGYIIEQVSGQPLATAAESMALSPKSGVTLVTGSRLLFSAIVRPRTFHSSRINRLDRVREIEQPANGAPPYA